MPFVNPEGNGVRILSLDGGDTRCLSQLLILQELMHRLEHDHGRPVRPCEYFHSITGVGASGVIAILLGVLGMTVENAMRTFTAICEKVFPPEGCDKASRSDRLTQEIEQVLDELELPHSTRMEGDLDLSAGCHVSICYSSASIIRCRMFRNYKSRQFSYNPTIIEAVRAAWATPGLFSSLRIGTPSNQEELISAVNGFNNPALEAIREARDIFGRNRLVSTFISLGSGTSAPVSISSDGFLEKSVQQTENVEEGIERLLGTSDIYFRFSPHHTIQYEHLAVDKQLEAIVSYTRAYAERERISRSMDDFLTLSARTSNINLELKDTASHLKNTTTDAEPNASSAQVFSSHSLYNDELLLAELRIPGLQCGSPLAGCMDGTREDILQNIVTWTTDFAAPNILWLKGHPGVGKSAIAAKIVEELGALRCLGSSFFFQRQNYAALTPLALWRTVAYDLARHYPTIRRVIVAKLQELGVSAATVNVEKLFRHLIHEPLTGCEDIQNAKLPVLVIDALDECGGLEGQHSQHRKALMKTLENWSRLPRKFKLIVTSRGENDIERLFSKITHHPIEILAGQTVDAQSREDVQVFLRNQLREIAIQYPRSLPPDWPGIQTVKGLAEKAAGLFIWAETVVKFIALGDPPRRLDQVLRGGGIGDLGVLYGEVLSTAFRESSEEDLGDFRSVIGGIILAKAPLSFSPLAQLLSIEDHTVEHICNSLQSVLDSKEVLLFHHQSFVDFLLDEKKCPSRYLINPTSERRKLTLACFRTMDNKLLFNICGLNSSYLRNVDIPDLSSCERESIPAYLSYSCSWWADHLVETEFEAGILDRVQYFMSTHFLWWLEVFSIHGRVNEASKMLSELIGWIPAHHESAVEMARDMQKFVTAFANVISHSAPHIYLSALPFSPRNSAVWKQYAHEYSHTLVIQDGGLSNWPAIQNVLVGHSDSVNSVAFSPDGKSIASGSKDNSVRVWDAETGKAVAGPFEGHERHVSTVAFSPDGKRIVSGSWDRTIRVWDAETGEMVAGPFEGHGGIVNSVVISPDGKRIASGSSDKTIRVWDAVTGEIIAGPLEGHCGWVNSVAFSPDGNRIVSGSYDNTIRVWNAETGKVIAGPFKGPSGTVNSVAFSPDGKRIASGSSDKAIRVRDADTGEVVAGPFKGHSGTVNSVAFSPDGKRIVSGSFDKTTRVWNAQTGKAVAGPFKGHGGVVNSVAFSPDGKRVASGSSDKTIRLWNAETGNAVTGSSKGHNGIVNCVAVSPDGKSIASGSSDNTIRVWDAETGKATAGPFEGHRNWVKSVAFSPDGKRIVSGSCDNTIRLWNTETGTAVAGTFDGHSGLVESVAFLPDGKRIASGSSDNTIRLWDVETGKAVVGSSKGHSGTINSVAFSSDGKRFASGSSDKTIRVWDAETGKAFKGPFKGHSGIVNSVTFSPDGKRIASGSDDKTTRVWDAETGEVVAGPFEGHRGWVNSVAFSPDGKCIVSGSDDKTIRLWDAETGKVVAGPFEGHSDRVTSVAFSPDGKYVVSGSADTTIRVWNAGNGKAIVGSFESHSGGGNSVTSSPSGKRILYVSEDRTSRASNVPVDSENSNRSCSYFADESRMEDGWIFGPNSELLFWVPPSLRVGLLRPGNSLFIGAFVTTRLDLTSFVHGELWNLCKGRRSLPDCEGTMVAGSSIEPASSPEARVISVPSKVAELTLDRSVKQHKSQSIWEARSLRDIFRWVLPLGTGEAEAQSI